MKIIYTNNPGSPSWYFPAVFKEVIKVAHTQQDALRTALNWAFSQVDNLVKYDEITIHMDREGGQVEIGVSTAKTKEHLTDMQKFIMLYSEIGIKLYPVINESNEYGYQYLQLKAPEIAEKRESIIGYSGFITQIYFDEKGNFISQGIWE